MNRQLSLLCAAIALAWTGLAGAAQLACGITPGTLGSNTSGVCTSNIPAYSYSASYVVTGLAPGTYDFSWSRTVTPGFHLEPQLTCSTDTCSQALSSWHLDADETVTVVVTNTATNAQQTLTRSVVIGAVCAGPGSSGYVWC